MRGVRDPTRGPPRDPRPPTSCLRLADSRRALRLRLRALRESLYGPRAGIPRFTDDMSPIGELGPQPRAVPCRSDGDAPAGARGAATPWPRRDHPPGTAP